MINNSHGCGLNFEQLVSGAPDWSERDGKY